MVLRRGRPTRGGKGGFGMSWGKVCGKMGPAFAVTGGRKGG